MRKTEMPEDYFGPPAPEILDIISVLEKAGKWLVLAHEKPDGDTIGCSFAMAHAGARLSKEVMLGGPDIYPGRYEFLAAGINFNVLNEIPCDFIGTGGAVICLDTSTAGRSVQGVEDLQERFHTINIDHHSDNERFCAINWVDPTSSATGEMVTELLSVSPWGIDRREAEALYVAIVTDNGYFKFSSTTKRSYKCAIRLMEAGAVPGDLMAVLDSNMSAEILSLWGRAFSRTELFAGGRSAFFWLSKDDFEQTGASRSGTEGLVNFLLKIKGVGLAVLFSEADGEIRVNLRARAPFSAHRIALAFGGGGHEVASGCVIRASLAEAVSAVITEIEKYAAGYIAPR
ncbi:MAG: bifunctional oligoribonuclease/PAP phosphatase NrnA [Synergistaceae bacterium]|jgi:phosphoesterase RecJ-like protein|nr:bifunctional oligoribonuclease/PAP phosphatase NrnA [Synergistaceae bacterium]